MGSGKGGKSPGGWDNELDMRPQHALALQVLQQVPLGQEDEQQTRNESECEGTLLPHENSWMLVWIIQKVCPASILGGFQDPAGKMSQSRPCFEHVWMGDLCSSYLFPLNIVKIVLENMTFKSILNL